MARRFEQAKKYTEKYKSSLKPCRICGNKDVRICSERGIFPPCNLWSVSCSTYACDCTGAYPFVKQAIMRWNEMQEQHNE